MVHVHENVTWWRMYKTKAPSDDSLLCVVVVYLRKEHPSGNVGSYDLGGEGIHGARQNLSGLRRQVVCIADLWLASRGTLYIPRDPARSRSLATPSRLARSMGVSGEIVQRPCDGQSYPEWEYGIEGAGRVVRCALGVS